VVKLARFCMMDVTEKLLLSKKLAEKAKRSK
jgi:hypothetical protein